MLLIRLGLGARPSLGNQRRYSSGRNPYDVLGLHKKANKKEIKAAYIRLSKIYHPDKNIEASSTVSEYQDIRNAYDTLIALPEPKDQDTQRGNDGTGYGPGTASGRSTGYRADPHNDFKRNGEFWNRRDKARSVDDWVKNVERNARIRKKMSNGKNADFNKSRDFFYGHDGMFEGKPRKEMFYAPEARKNDTRFINNIDRAYQFYRMRVILGRDMILSERLFDIHAFFYFFFLRWFLRIGAKVMLLLAFLLYSLDSHEYDVQLKKK
jgi:curved DNA-binding protein CbpA